MRRELADQLADDRIGDVERRQRDVLARLRRRSTPRILDRLLRCRPDRRFGGLAAEQQIDGSRPAHDEEGEHNDEHRAARTAAVRLRLVDRLVQADVVQVAHVSNVATPIPNAKCPRPRPNAENAAEGTIGHVAPRRRVAPRPWRPRRACRGTSGAIYVQREIENVPVARLTENLEREARENLRDAIVRVNLARLHGMAYALDSETAPAVKIGERESVWYGYEPKIVPYRAEEKPRSPAAQAHLDEAIRWCTRTR